MSELPVDPLPENDNYPDARDFVAVADAAAAEQPPFRALPWRSYLRCSFLLAIFVAVGFTAWRPAMLRCSVLMSAVSPSRGDSLAWQVVPEPVPPPTPRKLLPSPDEWRLAADHRDNWQAARSTNSDVFSYQGGPLPKRSWNRDSTNPWAWEDDSAFGRRRVFDQEFQPNQKPATSFRADDSAGWGNVAAPPPPRDAARPDDRFAAGRTVPSLTPLPRVSDAGAPPVTPMAAEQAVQDVFSALQIPSLSPWTAGDTPLQSPSAPGTASIGQTAAPIAPESAGPASSTGSAATAVRAGTDGEAGDSGAALFGVSDGQAGTRVAPLVTPPLTLQRTDGETAPAGGWLDGQNRDTVAAGSAPASPTTLVSATPSGTAASPVATDGTGSLRPSGLTSGGGSGSGSGTPSGMSESGNTATAAGGVDWKNHEITGAIEGAYLTVYPKLKFIGLCVPGQDYIRKYNQVAVPMDLVEKKLSARDGRTPYGKYYIAGRERDSAGAARLVLSWPSPDDARRIGLAPESTQAIENAWMDKILPPQTTAAGGGVAIEEAGPGQEWTAGGLGLEKPQMEELFLALPDGAWIFIQE
ncbi:MAG: hypothetical protein LIQ31_04605 [Planctomycetes bacterium]|nr:hypothetical protein [Planctomycetota bacterium]